MTPQPAASPARATRLRLPRRHPRRLTTALAVLPLAGVGVGLAGLASADATSPVTATFATTSSWDTGYSAGYTLRNTGSAVRHGWRLEFDLPAGARITSLWEGRASATSGHVTVTPASWNADLAAGASATVGFVVTSGGSGGSGGRPAGCLVDGAACAGGPATTGPSGPVTTTTAPPVTTAPSTTRPPTTTTTKPSTTTITTKPPATTTKPPATTTPPVTSTPLAGGAHAAPYVDTSLYPAFDLVGWSAATGVREFTLAFVVAGSGCTPAWGGVSALDADQVAAQIPKLRAAGGDVRVSFGGAAGRELALVCPDATSLASAYRQVVQRYGLTRIDLDVEGSATADAAANTRRGQALATLQREARAAGSQLRVSLTLPVLPTGLTPDGLGVVRATTAAGVDIDAVNVMAMDFGDGAAPNPAGQMGRYAIDAAKATQQQLVSTLGLSGAAAWARIAVTPMIGVNDTSTEVFTTADARQLVDFASSVHLGWLAFWSGARDRACPGGPQSWASATCSGIAQQPGEFSTIFSNYRG